MYIAHPLLNYISNHQCPLLPSLLRLHSHHHTKVVCFSYQARSHLRGSKSKKKNIYPSIDSDHELASPFHSKSQGDIFTTTILGYRCTFIQSAAHVHRFATAPRSLLDVTGAYKLIASGVIGEEAFIGPTRTLTRLVLAPARLDSLDDRLWDLAQEMISQDKLNLSTKQWTTVTPTGWLDDVIFALDLAALMGPTSPGLLQPVAGHFRVLDSDLSLLGLLTGGRARTRAKDSLIQLLRQHVRHHLCLAARRVSDPQSSISAEAELPELLLRSELEAPCNGEVDECLRAYHEGTSTEAMLELIECKVNYVALFIYGYVGYSIFPSPSSLFLSLSLPKHNKRDTVTFASLFTGRIAP